MKPDPVVSRQGGERRATEDYEENHNPHKKAQFHKTTKKSHPPKKNYLPLLRGTEKNSPP